MVGVGERIGIGELAGLGIFAKMPNAAKHSQLGQVTPSHAK